MSRCQLVHDLRKCPVVVGSPQTQTQRDQVTRIIHSLIVQRGLDNSSDDGNDIAGSRDRNPVISQKKQPAAGHNRLVLSRRVTKQVVAPSVTSNNNNHSDNVVSDDNNSSRPSGETKTGQPLLSDPCFPTPDPGGLVTVFSCTAADNGSSTTTESSDEYSEMLTAGGDPFAESMDVVANGEEEGHGSRRRSCSSPIRTMADGGHGNMIVSCDGLSDVIDRSPSVFVDVAEEMMNVVIDPAPQPQLMLPYELLLSPVDSMGDTEGSSSMVVQLHPSQQQPSTSAIPTESSSSSSSSSSHMIQQQMSVGSPVTTTSHSIQTGQGGKADPLLPTAQTAIDNAMDLQPPPVDVVSPSAAPEDGCGVHMDDDASDVDGEHDNKCEDDVRQPEGVVAAAGSSYSSSYPHTVMPTTAALDVVAPSSSSVKSTNSINSSHSKNSNNGSSSSGGGRANKSKLRRLIATDVVVVNANAASSGAAVSHQHHHQQQQDQPQARDDAGGSSLRPVPPASSYAGTGTGTLSSVPNRTAATPTVDKSINVNTPVPTPSRGNSSSGIANNVNVVPTPPSGHRSTHTSLRNFGKKQHGHGSAGATRMNTGAAVTSSVASGALIDQSKATVDDDCHASPLTLQLDDSAVEK